MLRSELDEILEDLRVSRAEDAHVEAKAAGGGLPRRLWETLSAFSNSRGGGVVILGVNESAGFAVTGVADPGRVQQDLASMCDQMSPPLRPLVQRFEVTGRWVIVAEVAELPHTEKPCFYQASGLSNGVFLRVADGDRRATAHEVQALREGRGQPQHDIEPVLGAKVEDLDAERLRRFLDQLRGRADAPWLEWDDERLLRTFKVLVRTDEGLVPTLAGWLCFASYPQERFPQLGLAFVRYPAERAGERGPGGERFLDNRFIEGPIPHIVREAVRSAKLNMQRRGIVQGLYREDLWEYPEEVLREAVVNALIHRDLSPSARGSQAQLQMYADRLEVLNPGGLFGPLSVEELGEPGREATRHPHLVRLVTELTEDTTGRRLCENRGTGIAVMIERLREAGMAPPEFEDSLLRFRVRFPNHTLFDADTLAWLDERLGSFGGDSHRRVLAWLRHTSRDLDNDTYRRLSGVDSRVATRELSELVDRGILTRTGTRRWARYGLAKKAPDVRPAAGREHVNGRAEPADRANALLTVLAAEGPLSRAQLAERLGMSRSAVGYWLRRLRGSGQVVTTTGSTRSRHTQYLVASHQHVMSTSSSIDEILTRPGSGEEDAETRPGKSPGKCEAHGHGGDNGQ